MFEQKMLPADDNQAIENLKHYVLGRYTRKTISNTTEFMGKRNDIDKFISSHDNNHDAVNIFDILNLLSHTMFSYNPRRAGRIMEFVIFMNENEPISQTASPLMEEKMDKIEKCIYKDLTQEAIGHELSTNCPICQEQYTQDDNISVLPCNGKHYYHTECIKGWFKVSNVCPVCRENIANKI